MCIPDMYEYWFNNHQLFDDISKSFPISLCHVVVAYAEHEASWKVEGYIELLD